MKVQVDQALEVGSVFGSLAGLMSVDFTYWPLNWPNIASTETWASDIDYDILVRFDGLS